MPVYVRSQAGKWLMPTRAAKARVLLKQGKAKVVRRTPFAIQLTSATPEYVQPVVVGIDDGGKQVGVAAVSGTKVLFQEEVTLRSDIKRKLDRRRQYRRSRRNRNTRYRRSRFLNRAKGQVLPPSIKAKKDAIVQTIQRLALPRPALIRLEDAYFDFQAMENPGISGADYQHGPLLYEKNYRTAARTRDGHRCRVCHRQDRLEVHHLRPLSEGGTNRLVNLMTLCDACHWKHHHEGLVLPKPKPPFFVFAAHVQQGKRYVQDELRRIAPLQTTFGFITSHQRREAGVAKTHVNDAVMIANPQAVPLPKCVVTRCVEFRKRSLHEATARKGRKEPNRTQRRNAKNTFRLNGVQRWDTVNVFGKIAFVSGFTGTSACRVVTLGGEYLTHPAKSSNQVNLSQLVVVHRNQGRISHLQAAALPPHP